MPVSSAASSERVRVTSTVERRAASLSGLGPSDAELVEGALAGDIWAQQALFRRYLPMAHALAFRLAPLPQDAEDIVQDSMAQALDGLTRLSDAVTFPAWLRTIVVRTAARHLRRRRLLRRLGLDGSERVETASLVAPNARPDTATELAQLYRAIDRLPTNLRLVLILRQVEGWTVQEIARELRVSEGTVKRWFRRSLVACRHEAPLGEGS